MANFPVSQDSDKRSRIMYAQRSFYVVIQDIEATRAARGQPKHEYRDAASQEARIRHLTEVFRLTHFARGAHGEIRPLDYEAFRKSFVTTWGVRKRPRRKGADLWTARQSDWKASYMETLQHAVEQLHSRKGLPLFNRQDAVQSSDKATFCTQISATNDGEKEFQRLSPTVVPGVLPEHLRHGVYVAPETRGRNQQSSSGVSHSVLHGSTKYKRTSSESGKTGEASVRLLAAKLASRKSTEAKSAHSYGVSKTKSSTASPSRSRRLVPWLNSRTFKTPTQTSSVNTDDRTPRILCPQGPLTVAGPTSIVWSNDVVQDIATPRAFDEPGPFYFDEVSGEFKRIHQMMSIAMPQLLASIGQFDHIQSPLVQSPSPALEELQVRCWGTMWHSTQGSLVDNKAVFVLEVMKSFVSAFIVDKVVTRQASELCSFRQRLLDSGDCGQLAFSIFADLEDQGSSFTRQYYARLVKDERRAFQENIRADTDILTSELWHTLLPQLNLLSSTAGLHSTSSGQNAAVWYEALRSSITPIIQRTLHLTFKLLSLDIEYTFLWFDYGERLDADTMKSNTGVLFNAGDRGKIAFTEFPGLKVTAADNGAERVYHVRAVVKPRM